MEMTRLTRAAVRWFRRDMKELMALDDRLLADIGLGRVEIQPLAYCGHPPRKLYLDC